jgi:hypothetical protein
MSDKPKTFTELIERVDDKKEFQFGLTERNNNVKSLTEVSTGFMFMCALAETEIRPGAPENGQAGPISE